MTLSKVNTERKKWRHFMTLSKVNAEGRHKDGMQSAFKNSSLMKLGTRRLTQDKTQYYKN